MLRPLTTPKIVVVKLLNIRLFKSKSQYCRGIEHTHFTSKLQYCRGIEHTHFQPKLQYCRGIEHTHFKTKLQYCRGIEHTHFQDQNRCCRYSEHNSLLLVRLILNYVIHFAIQDFAELGYCCRANVLVVSHTIERTAAYVMFLDERVSRNVLANQSIPKRLIGNHSVPPSVE